MTGKFVTFEGPEGSGKSTCIRELQDSVLCGREDVLYVREPGGTRVGEAIRDILQHSAAGEDPGYLSELMLFQASRAQLCEKVISPALKQGLHVISDRFFDSTTAYQGYGRGISMPEVLEELSVLATGGLIPDKTILLDLPIEAGFARITRVGEPLDRFE